MPTKPVPLSLYARWTFHLGRRQKVVYQLVPQVVHPVEHVVPYLEYCLRVMGGLEAIPRAAMPPTCAEYPGSYGEPINPTFKFPDREFVAGGDLDLCDLFMSYWWEVWRNMPGPMAEYVKSPPGYDWTVWYDPDNLPVSVAFCQYDRAGQPDPTFTVGRTSVAELVDALSAPSALENMFKL